ncbi:MAG: hypothetical protein AMXMBFR33_41210 [Candidatus Xenobia bacterium]
MHISQPAYDYYLTGNAANTAARPRPGLVLAGGGADQGQAMTWLLDRSDAGDIVVIRASGADGYNDYLANLPLSDGRKVDSVETFCMKEREGSFDPFVVERVRNAEAIFFAGGDQYQYLQLFEGTPLQDAVQQAFDRGVPVGGTSAGLALLGDPFFSAARDTVTSQEALADPLGPKVTLAPRFLEAEALDQVITDSHFSERERLGRLLVFLSREPGSRGLGVDEATAVLVDGELQARVVGEGAAHFVSLTEWPRLEAGRPLDLERAEVVRCEDGQSFDMLAWRSSDGTRQIYRVVQGQLQAGAPEPAEN